MTDDISKVVPPEAVPVKDDALNFGVVQAKDWVIPTACGVRVVDERMAYGWNECRKATIDRLSPAEVSAEGRFEQYVATLIAKNPDVQKLGDRLADWLDDDRFNTIEPILTGIAQRLAAVPESVTLTGAQIADLAEFAGLKLSQCAQLGESELETQITICECPAKGVLLDGEEADPGAAAHYAHIAYYSEYPDEGCVGLGPELAAATATCNEAQT